MTIQRTLFKVMWRCLVVDQMVIFYIPFLQSCVVPYMVSVLEAVPSLVVDRGVG